MGDTSARAELAMVFQAIPVCVSSLNLKCNFLGQKNVDELILAIKRIQQGVTELDLSQNHLESLSASSLSAVLLALHAGVSSLDLSGNNLGKKSGDANHYKNPDDFYAALNEWSGENMDCIEKQRNCVHQFFLPAHKTTSALLVKSIFADLDMVDREKSFTPGV